MHKFKFYLPFIFILLFISTSYSQSDETKITYKAKYINMIALDKSGKEVLRNPMGKDVMIFFDSFFKSYRVMYHNSDGEVEQMQFKYISDQPTSNKGVKSYKMKDNYNSFFYILDMLEEIGKLKILTPKEYDGLVVWIVIENAIKTLE